MPIPCQHSNVAMFTILALRLLYLMNLQSNALKQQNRTEGQEKRRGWALESQLCRCPGEERYSNNLACERNAGTNPGLLSLCINGRKYSVHLLQWLAHSRTHKPLRLFNQLPSIQLSDLIKVWTKLASRVDDSRYISRCLWNIVRWMHKNVK